MIERVKEKAVSVCFLVTEIGVTVSALPFFAFLIPIRDQYSQRCCLPSPRNG